MGDFDGFSSSSDRSDGGYQSACSILLTILSVALHNALDRFLGSALPSRLAEKLRLRLLSNCCEMHFLLKVQLNHSVWFENCLPFLFRRAAMCFEDGLSLI